MRELTFKFHPDKLHPHFEISPLTTWNVDSVKREQYYSEGAGKDEGESDDLPRPVYLQMGKVS